MIPATVYQLEFGISLTYAIMIAQTEAIRTVYLSHIDWEFQAILYWSNVNDFIGMTAGTQGSFLELDIIGHMTCCQKNQSVIFKNNRS